MLDSIHIPVMAAEFLAHLNPKSGERFLDCTLGGGGHTSRLLDSNADIKVVATDRDHRAVERAKEKLAHYGDRLEVKHVAFSSLEKVFAHQKFDGILADLGVSTDQLKDNRGFSFYDDVALDMRMDESKDFSASHIVNELGDEELFKILKEGGVGKEARALCLAIIRARPINSTKELSKIINQAIGRGDSRSNPSTVAFQAIRVAVNDEFSELRALLKAIPGWAKPGTRVAIICFHSLEDKEVGRTFREWTSGTTPPASLPGAISSPSLGKMSSKKAILPTAAEIEVNPASRSARLRVFEFI